MFFNTKNPPILKIFDQPIENATTYKLLGITIDNKLKFKFHLTNLTVKISKFLPIFYSIRNKTNVESKMLLYYSFIQSHLQYCCVIFLLSNQTCIQKIENVVKKIQKSLFPTVVKTFLKFQSIIYLNSCKFINSLLFPDSFFPRCFDDILYLRRKANLRFPYNFSLPIYKGRSKCLLTEILKIWNQIMKFIDINEVGYKNIFKLRTFFLMTNR